MFGETAHSVGLKRSELNVPFNRRLVGAFDGAEAGGDAGFAGGNGLAVAAAVGAFGQGLAVAFDFADVGFTFVGVGSHGEQGDAGGSLVQDQADGPAAGGGLGQGDDLGTVSVG